MLVRNRRAGEDQLLCVPGRTSSITALQHCLAIRHILGDADGDIARAIEEVDQTPNCPYKLKLRLVLSPSASHIAETLTHSLYLSTVLHGTHNIDPKSPHLHWRWSSRPGSNQWHLLNERLERPMFNLHHRPPVRTCQRTKGAISFGVCHHR